MVRELIDGVVGLRDGNPDMAPGDQAWWASYRSRLERVARQVSRAPFFVVCVCVIAARLVNFPVWHDHKEWQTVIHTVASVLTLLLVALLENTSRRAEQAPRKNSTSSPRRWLN